MHQDGSPIATDEASFQVARSRCFTEAAHDSHIDTVADSSVPSVPASNPFLQGAQLALSVQRYRLLEQSQQLMDQMFLICMAKSDYAWLPVGGAGERP